MMENQNNYSVTIELTNEEKFQMYMKLSKKEIISMLIENQRLIKFISEPQIKDTCETTNGLIWHGTRDPYSGEYIGPVYTTN